MVRRRIVVVDDDDMSRAGTAALLAAADDLDVVALTPDEAVARPRWDDVAVALVDATDRRREDDHFVGVTVVEAIRATGTSGRTVVVVVTAYSWLDALRVRMREARADLFFDRMDVQDRERLLEVVRHPERFRSRDVPAPADPEGVFRLGVVRATQVNEGLRSAGEMGWDDATVSRPGRRSRGEDAQKRQFARRSRLSARTRDGREPDREQDDPSWPQIARFLRWARQVPTGPDHPR